MGYSLLLFCAAVAPLVHKLDSLVDKGYRNYAKLGNLTSGDLG